MARRKKSSFFEDIIELASMLPWWIGILLAIVTYLLLHHVAIQPIEAAPTDLKHFGDVVSKQIWRTFAMYMQYIIPVAFMIGAILSGYRKLRKADHPSQNTTANNSNRVNVQNFDSAIECPVCGTHMVRRTAKKGSQAGKAFWGCSQYPSCKGTRTID